ncbi:MAG: vitamin K epoxide reductase family protein [Rhodothermales bacterium]|nr:vitamin K epoxide reductase family protein [Rhodothermales bacterium]
MQKATLDKSIYATALAGILVVVHLWLMVDRGFDRGCFGFSDPTPVVECEAVIQSDAGTLFGVSNSVWGLLFYVALGALSFVIGTGGAPTTARKARAALVYVGLAYSAYLVYVQATQIGAWCKLCLISAGLVAVLSVLVSLDLFGKQPVAE